MVREGLQRGNHDVLPVHFEKSTQGGARITATKAVGAKYRERSSDG